MDYKKDKQKLKLAEFIRTKITPCGGLRCTSMEAADMILHFMEESEKRLRDKNLRRRKC